MTRFSGPTFTVLSIALHQTQHAHLIGLSAILHPTLTVRGEYLDLLEMLTATGHVGRRGLSQIRQYLALLPDKRLTLAEIDRWHLQPVAWWTTGFLGEHSRITKERVACLPYLMEEVSEWICSMEASFAHSSN